MFAGAEQFFVPPAAVQQCVDVAGGVFKPVLVECAGEAGKTHSGQPVVLCYDDISGPDTVDKRKIDAVGAFVEYQRLGAVALRSI